MVGRLDLMRFAPTDTGLDRPIWIGQSVEVVVLPRRPGDRATVGRDCVAAGSDQDCGYRNARRWLNVNADLLCDLSAGWADERDFLELSRRLRVQNSSARRDPKLFELGRAITPATSRPATRMRFRRPGRTRRTSSPCRRNRRRPRRWWRVDLARGGAIPAATRR